MQNIIVGSRKDLYYVNMSNISWGSSAGVVTKLQTWSKKGVSIPDTGKT
jgi:hypothetical protein